MRPRVHANGVATWAFALDGPDVLAVATTRAGGVSDGPYGSLNLGFHVGDDVGSVVENRRRLCEALEVPTITVADQQHGARVVVVDEDLVGAGFDSLADAEVRLGATDALVTSQPGVALGILVADCAPVVLVDRVRHVVAVAHVGRAGAVLDVLGATVDTLRATFGTDPADLEAGVGPCVGVAGYEIGGPALDEVRAVLGDDLLAPTRPGHATFDLRGAVLRRLAEAGVAWDRTECADATTDAAPADLFSDRAARPCGRQMVVAALRTDPSGPSRPGR